MQFTVYSLTSKQTEFNFTLRVSDRVCSMYVMLFASSVLIALKVQVTWNTADGPEYQLCPDTVRDLGEPSFNFPSSRRISSLESEQVREISTRERISGGSVS